MTIRRSGWILAAVFPACWAAIAAAQIWGESEWAKAMIMPFVIIAFPAVIICHVADTDRDRARCMAFLSRAVTLFGNIEGRFIK